MNKDASTTGPAVMVIKKTEIPVHRRIFRPRILEGVTSKLSDGTRYQVAPDGSWRRIKLQ